MILWHTCQSGPESTLIGIIDGLAQALASNGDEQLWREMRRSETDAPDPLALIDLLQERLLARPAVIVLDDMHRTTADEIAPLLEMLDRLMVRRAVRVVLVDRTQPAT